MATTPKIDSNKSGGERDEANKRRFVGPAGVESHDLSNGGRATGDNDTFAEIGKRDLPQQHGGELQDDGTYAEGGVRGSPDLGDAKLHGHGGGRGKN